MIRGTCALSPLALLFQSSTLLVGWGCGVGKDTSAVRLPRKVTRAGTRLSSGHVTVRDVASIIVHSWRLRDMLVEHWTSKSRRRRSWRVCHGLTSVVASKVVGDLVTAGSKLLTGRCMNTWIAARR